MVCEVVVVSGVCIVIGIFGGSLKDVVLCELGVFVVCEVLVCVGVKGEEVGYVVFGYVINIELCDMYFLCVVVVNGGVLVEMFVFNVNCLCGLGLQVVVSVVQIILFGDVDVVIVGGVESMSCVLYFVFVVCWGLCMGDVKMVDMMFGVLYDLFYMIYMGVMVENVVCEFGIS